MKRNLISLFWTFLSFYLVYEPLKILLETGSLSEALYGFQGLPEFLFFISTLIYFWSYVLGAYLVFFRFYTEGRKWLPFLLLVPVALVAIFLRYFMQEMLGEWLFNVNNYAPGTTISYYIFDNLYFAIIYLSVGTIFFFVQYAQYKEVQQRELLLQNQKTELAFLRSQLNPHFLFNILNNIYSLIYYQSDNALKSVEKLSGLLRYALYEKAERVSLKKEMGNLNDFIDLHRMRLDHELPLRMQIAPEVFPLQIAPFLLIPFVENAFKHGNLKNPERPLFIGLRKQGEQLIFTVENEKRMQEKDEVGGIGIQNVKKRLELIYGKAATLDILEDEQLFRVTLKIALSAC
jgi:sensor histidine kinase YesM